MIVDNLVLNLTTGQPDPEQSHTPCAETALWESILLLLMKSSAHSTDSEVSLHVYGETSLRSDSALATPLITSDRPRISNSAKFGKADPSITDILPAEILDRIIHEVSSVFISVLRDPNLSFGAIKLHQVTFPADLHAFTDLRRVSRLFNSVVGPLVFSDTVIKLRHIPVKTTSMEPSLWQNAFEKHIRTLEGMAEQADYVSASRNPNEGDGMANTSASVWQWTKSLRIVQQGRCSGEREATEAYMQKFVRAIRGLRWLERVS